MNEYLCQIANLPNTYVLYIQHKGSVACLIDDPNMKDDTDQDKLVLRERPGRERFAFFKDFPGSKLMKFNDALEKTDKLLLPR